MLSSVAQPVSLAATTSRFHFASRPSLSTISEERTLATSTLNDEHEIEMQRSSQINFIENILNDIKTNSVLLNEILCVFRPSSNAGTFCRNVPIRFTSPQKLQNQTCISNKKSDEFSNHGGQATDSLARSSFMCSSTNSLNSSSTESFLTPKQVRTNQNRYKGLFSFLMRFKLIFVSIQN